MRTTLRALTALASISGCSVPATVTEPSPASAAPPVIVESSAPTSASEGWGPLEIAVGEALVRPSSFAPPREVGMTDEPFELGWSAVTGEFAVCVPSGGAECDLCEFHRPGGATERMGVGEDCGPERVPAPVLDARLAGGRFAIVDGDWIHGDELLLVVARRPGEPDVDGVAREVVEIGVRRRADDRVVWVDRIDWCYDGWCAPEVHIDAIAPSPDGQTIAVLMHSFAGEFTDSYPLRLLDADALAAALGE